MFKKKKESRQGACIDKQGATTKEWLCLGPWYALSMPFKIMPPLVLIIIFNTYFVSDEKNMLKFTISEEPNKKNTLTL